MNHVHRVSVDILRRGVEPPRHPLQLADTRVPLFALNFAEAPIPDAWRRGHLVCFGCSCIGQIGSDGTTALRVACGAHRETQPQSRGEACPRCGGTTWVTTPRGCHCSGCQYVAVETRLGS